MINLLQSSITISVSFAMSQIFYLQWQSPPNTRNKFLTAQTTYICIWWWHLGVYRHRKVYTNESHYYTSVQTYASDIEMDRLVVRTRCCYLSSKVLVIICIMITQQFCMYINYIQYHFISLKKRSFYKPLTLSM